MKKILLITGLVTMAAACFNVGFAEAEDNEDYGSTTIYVKNKTESNLVITQKLSQCASDILYTYGNRDKELESGVLPSGKKMKVSFKYSPECATKTPDIPMELEFDISSARKTKDSVKATFKVNNGSLDNPRESFYRVSDIHNCKIKKSNFDQMNILDKKSKE